MSILVTNRELLDRFRSGAPEALAEVYWEYVRKVERLLSAGFEVRGRGTRAAGACREPADLADLVQEVFVRAFSEKARLGYDGLRNYAPYLYTIARNVLIDWARARGREIPSPWAVFESAEDIVPMAEDQAPWEAAATMRVVEEYLAGLPHGLREVHRLRHEEGLSQEQAALRLGVGRQTLRTLERRLQDGLAATLDEAGIDMDNQPESAQVRSDNQQVGRHES
jgi:RNA polymerase sigma factor (sigma-70 family)